MTLLRIVDFDCIIDERGQLIALESMKNVPFDIKRVYYLTGLSQQYPRGFHAHKKLKQLVVCLSGKCRFVLNDGYQQEEVWLDTPNKGLLISQMIWREMYDFSADCVLMILANECYDKEDYIHDFHQFKSEIKNG